jgi:hypothetical protein
LEVGGWRRGKLESDAQRTRSPRRVEPRREGPPSATGGRAAEMVKGSGAALGRKRVEGAGWWWRTTRLSSGCWWRRPIKRRQRRLLRMRRSERRQSRQKWCRQRLRRQPRRRRRPKLQYNTAVPFISMKILPLERCRRTSARPTATAAGDGRRWRLVGERLGVGGWTRNKGAGTRTHEVGCLEVDCKDRSEVLEVGGGERRSTKGVGQRSAGRGLRVQAGGRLEGT